MFIKTTKTFIKRLIKTKFDFYSLISILFLFCLAKFIYCIILILSPREMQCDIYRIGYYVFYYLKKKKKKSKFSKRILLLFNILEDDYLSVLFFYVFTIF